MATSASRVTRKGYACTISIPGNTNCRLAAINCSNHTNVVPDLGVLEVLPLLEVEITATSWGRESGTFTRAKFSVPWLSPTTTARFKLPLEMCGNGRPGSNANGVRTGNTFRRKYSSI